MAAKLPYQRWFWADWSRDTRCLTAEARGVWIDLIGYLWSSTRTGVAAFTAEEWQRQLSLTTSEWNSALPQLQKFKIAMINMDSVTGLVTIRSRRVAREKTMRKNATLRQIKSRTKRSSDASSDASVTAPCDSVLNSHCQKQSQRQRHSQRQNQSPEQTQEHRSDSGEQQSGKNIPAPLSRTRGVVPDSLAAPVWEAYATAYQRRYGVAPVRNQRVNATLKQLRERVGLEHAPAVAAFYVVHNDALYVRSRHPTTLLLRDAEGLMTQMRTGQKATRQEAMQAETKDAIQDQVARVSALLGGKP